MLFSCSFACSFLPLRIILFAYLFNLPVIQESKVIPKELEREENPNMVESTLVQDGGDDVFPEVSPSFYNLPHNSLLTCGVINCVFYCFQSQPFDPFAPYIFVSKTSATLIKSSENMASR